MKFTDFTHTFNINYLNTLKSWKILMREIDKFTDE